MPAHWLELSPVWETPNDWSMSPLSASCSTSWANSPSKLSKSKRSKSSKSSSKKKLSRSSSKKKPSKKKPSKKSSSWRSSQWSSQRSSPSSASAGTALNTSIATSETANIMRRNTYLLKNHERSTTHGGWPAQKIKQRP